MVSSGAASLTRCGSTHGGGDDPRFFCVWGGLHPRSTPNRRTAWSFLQGPEESQKKARDHPTGEAPRIIAMWQAFHRTRFFLTERHVRSVLGDATLKVAMFHCCPIGLFLSRYFSNETTTQIFSRCTENHVPFVRL